MKLLKTMFIVLAIGNCITGIAAENEITQEKSKSTARTIALNGGKVIGYTAGTAVGVTGTLLGFSLTREAIKSSSNVDVGGAWYSDPEIYLGTSVAIATYASAQFAWYCLKNGISFVCSLKNNDKKF